MRPAVLAHYNSLPPDFFLAIAVQTSGPVDSRDPSLPGCTSYCTNLGDRVESLLNIRRDWR
jgi:hypothetical protein